MLPLLAVTLLAVAMPRTIQASGPTEQEKTYLAMYGYWIAMQNGLPQLGLSPEELDAVIAGLKSGAAMDDPPAHAATIGQAMQDYLKKKADAYKPQFLKRLSEEEEKDRKLVEARAAENRAKAASFWKKLENDRTVMKTASGLYYKKTDDGRLPFPTSNDTVTIHYTGTLIDGTVFDSSEKNGGPVTFGLRNVIPGFSEGLQLVGKGGKITLYIPPSLGYGNKEVPGIPPGSTLIFDVEIVDVGQPPAPAAAPRQSL